MTPRSGQNVQTLWKLLGESAALLWKDWPKNMEAVFITDQEHKYTLRGECPHCLHSAVFMPVTSTYFEEIGSHVTHWICGMQCQGCQNYILSIVQCFNNRSLTYITHYPIGKPNDNVAPEIPVHIAADFKEALRCLWVDAYNATAEMCRRAVEACCIDLGAPKSEKWLDDKMDWLESQRKITPFLRDVAHKIGLGGNRAAHPSNTAPPASATAPAITSELTIEKEHAEAIVKFTREFFHHVYVVPKELDKYDFSKPKGTNP